MNAEGLRYLLQCVSVLSVGKVDQAVSFLLPSNGSERKKLLKGGTAEMPLLSWNLRDVLPSAKKFLRLLDECFSTKKNLTGKLLPRGFDGIHPLSHELPVSPTGLRQ